jgi:hypothetical protein
MSARWLSFALATWLATAPARAEDPACVECRYAGELQALFVAARALGPGWETLGEMPTDPQQDPELRAAGVRAVHALHYTRERSGGGSEVCSLEVWGFASPAQARGARAGMQRELWRLDVRGNLLVMLRGASLQRGHSLRQGLLPACHRLADLTLERADLLLREAPASALQGARPAR